MQTQCRDGAIVGKDVGRGLRVFSAPDEPGRERGVRPGKGIRAGLWWLTRQDVSRTAPVGVTFTALSDRLVVRAAHGG